MSEKKEAKKAKKAEKKAAKGKKGDKGFKVFIAILLVVAIVGEFYIGLTIPGKINAAITAASTSTEEDEGIQLTLTPGTYGGVDFKTQEDVVNYYIEAYNKTKSQTAKYKDGDGNVSDFYKMVGTEDLTVKEGTLLIDGSPANNMVQSLIPQVLGGIFQPNVNGLPPCANRNPEYDTDENGDSLTACRVTQDDVDQVSVEEKDGKIVITLLPKAVSMSHKGLDAQGHFFNSLGAIDNTLDTIGIKWASGTTTDNCKVVYEQGTVVATIDPATGEIVEADYTMNVNIDVTHVSFMILNDRGAALTLLYTQHFPADDQYLLEKKQLTRM